MKKFENKYIKIKYKKKINKKMSEMMNEKISLYSLNDFEDIEDRIRLEGEIEKVCNLIVRGAKLESQDHIIVIIIPDNRNERSENIERYKNKVVSEIENKIVSEINKHERIRFVVHNIKSSLVSPKIYGKEDAKKYLEILISRMYENFNNNVSDINKYAGIRV